MKWQIRQFGKCLTKTRITRPNTQANRERTLMSSLVRPACFPLASSNIVNISYTTNQLFCRNITLIIYQNMRRNLLSKTIYNHAIINDHILHENTSLTKCLSKRIVTNRLPLKGLRGCKGYETIVIQIRLLFTRVYWPLLFDHSSLIEKQRSQPIISRYPIQSARLVGGEMQSIWQIAALCFTDYWISMYRWTFYLKWEPCFYKIREGRGMIYEDVVWLQTMIIYLPLVRIESK